MKRFKNMLKNQANNKQHHSQAHKQAGQTDIKMSKRANRKAQASITYFKYRTINYGIYF